MTTESTPVTIHTHTGGTTTFVNGTPNEIQTLAYMQIVALSGGGYVIAGDDRG